MRREHDVMITAESKGNPAHPRDGAGFRAKRRYVLARKSVKLYMSDVRKTEVKSITTANLQALYLSGSDADYLAGKRVLIVDDVISTGESLYAMEQLVSQSGGTVAGAHGDPGGRRRHRPHGHYVPCPAAAV